MSDEGVTAMNTGVLDQTDNDILTQTLNGAHNHQSSDAATKFFETAEMVDPSNTKEFAGEMQKIIKGMCICGHCKLCHNKKLNYGLGPFDTSTYKDDFPEHPLQSKMDLLPKHRVSHQALGGTQMPMTSLNKKDFKDPGLVSTISARPVEISNSNGIQLMGAPFPKKTSYAQDFIDWKQKEPVGIIRPSVLDRNKFKLPFHGKPSNREYGNFPLAETRKPLNGASKFGKSQYENPLGPTRPFKATTNYNTDYQPFELEDDGNFGVNSRPKRQDHTANACDFPSRFKTTYQDYSGNPVKAKGTCPAKGLVKEVKQRIDKLGLTSSFRF